VVVQNPRPASDFFETPSQKKKFPTNLGQLEYCKFKAYYKFKERERKRKKRKKEKVFSVIFSP
jgi:hypothetical protein